MTPAKRLIGDQKQSLTLFLRGVAVGRVFTPHWAETPFGRLARAGALQAREHGPDDGGLQGAADRRRASLAAAAEHDLARSKTSQEGQSIACRLGGSDRASGEPEIPRPKHEPLLRWQRGAR
jgi:hypothetical protein